MAMSTPIAQLPKQINAQHITAQEEDPMVSDVITEMEKEFSASAPPPPATPQPTVVPSGPPVQYAQMYATPPPYMSYQQKKQWIDIPIAKRAAVCAIVALVMFYPFETGVIYTKVPFLAKMESYERIVRTLLLAVLLYVLMWKLDI